MYLYSLYTPAILNKTLVVFTLNIQTHLPLKTVASENIDSLKLGNRAIEK